MQPITPLLLALAVVASAGATLDKHCAGLRLGEEHDRIGIKIKEVTTTYLMDTKEKEEQVYVPKIPQRKGNWLNADVTACNWAGHKPYLIKTSNRTAEIHCTYRDIIRCPHGITVTVVERYNDGPLIPTLE